MRKGLLCLSWLWLFCIGHGSTIMVLPVNGAISPALSDYLTRGIAKAQTDGTSLVVIQLDTPGGLDKSMREIIKGILSSSVPVATYVAPSGARAASAGTFIAYASHIAVMAPGTNIGAASPVSIGTPAGGSSDKPKAGEDKSKAKDKSTKASPPSDQEKMAMKVSNDAKAYIRSLAQLRGRNAEWAVEAVGQAATLTAREAVDKQVVDYMAQDIQELLALAQNRTVSIMGGDQVIAFDKPYEIQTVEPDWRTKLLMIITDPSIAYMLLLLGVYGIFFEFANPGFVVPGVVGAIAMLLALYALQMLPINYAGLGLIFLGIIFMVSEAFVPSFGALGLGGIVAFVTGSILLIEDPSLHFQIPLYMIVVMTITSSLVLFGLVGMAVRARARMQMMGYSTLVGTTGVVLANTKRFGQAKINGEIWGIRTNKPLLEGEEVRVIRARGLHLKVEPLKPNKGE